MYLALYSLHPNTEQHSFVDPLTATTPVQQSNAGRREKHYAQLFYVLL